MLANPERGEVELMLDGKAYPLRPSYTAMRAIEHGTGKTLVQLSAAVGRGAFGGLPLDEMAVIVVEGIKAAGRDRNDDPMLTGIDGGRIGELIYDTGVIEVTKTIERFLMNALSGGTTKKKKKGDQATAVSTTGD